MQRLNKAKRNIIIVFFSLIILNCGCSRKNWSETEQIEITNIVNEEENEKEANLDSKIIVDYLTMDSEEFVNKYDVNELYVRGILWCDMDAWKYHGTQLDSYQETNYYFNVVDITAIRFVNVDLDNKYNAIVDGQGSICIKVFGDYAISMYISGSKNETEPQLLEVSFIKVKTEDEIISEELYSYLENNYYQVQVELQDAQWTESPDSSRRAYISNGSLPKHPSQIFIRYQENRPDVIMRRTRECRVVGWIDENHLICDEVDVGPILIHLENEEVEKIKKECDDFDAYGAEYKIEDGYLICKSLDEEIYRWEIMGCDGDISITKENMGKYEKYFQFKQGELARIEGIENAEDCSKMGYLNSHFGGITFEVDDGVHVQYSNIASIEEELLPNGVIIMNPNSELGFMNAKVGMNFEEIQKNAYKEDINKGFMYSEDLEVYYIKYADDYYEYTFISQNADGSNSWLLIRKR